MSLQVHRLERALLEARLAAPDFPPPWRSMDQLADAARREVDGLRRARAEQADGPVERLRVAFDDAVRTDTVEWMDRDTLPPAERTDMVRRLHRFNRAIFSYPRFARMLRPIVDAVHTRERRPVRLLELASGAGELTLTLDRLARRRRLPMWLTGSDVVPSHVEAANRAARASDHRARFRLLDAMDLHGGLTPGDYDVIFIVQAAHHFGPGQLATMIAQARLAGAQYFVLIDGRRSLATLALLGPAVAVIGGPRSRLVADAVISARKFYSDVELRILAHTAAPDARRIDLAVHHPGFVQLTVRF